MGERTPEQQRTTAHIMTRKAGFATNPADRTPEQRRAIGASHSAAAIAKLKATRRKAYSPGKRLLIELLGVTKATTVGKFVGSLPPAVKTLCDNEMMDKHKDARHAADQWSDVKRNGKRRKGELYNFIKNYMRRNPRKPGRARKVGPKLTAYFTKK